MVSSLNHPHIVTVYDAGEYQDRQYLITEFVDGGTLRQWAARPRGWQQIVELLIGVADGIAVAHEAGILHRDIKPENILLAKNGYAKLADFGLAKLLEVDPLADDVLEAIKPGDNSTLIGTAAYMSPEQAQGRTLDGRSDVYSFGLVLYELLSGDEAAGAPGQEGSGAAAARGRGAARRCARSSRKRSSRSPRIATRRCAISSSTCAGSCAARGSTTSAGAVHSTLRSPRRARPTRDAASLAATRGLCDRPSPWSPPCCSPPTIATLCAASRASKAVAVLPFANETGDADDEHISEGLGDTLRERLMELPGVSVQARASSVSFRGQNADLRTIARSLGVGMLINGTVRRQGTTLEVLVEVLDEKGFAVRPALTFRAWRAGFASASTADRVGGRRTCSSPRRRPRSPRRRRRRRRKANRANMLVLFGNHYDHEVRDDLTVDEKKLDKAIDFFRRATVADPSSIAAHSRLASALLYKGDVDEARGPLLSALKLAESIDATSASAEVSDVYYTTAIYLLRTRQDGVEDAYEKALALNPNNADALGSYALWLLTHSVSRTRQTRCFAKPSGSTDRRFSRYSDYGEYLGTTDDIDKLHELGSRDRRSLSEPTRLSSARAPVRVDRRDRRRHRVGPQGLAGSARRSRDALAGRRAILEDRRLRRRGEIRPDPAISQLWFQRRYNELIDLAQDYVIEHPVT